MRFRLTSAWRAGALGILLGASSCATPEASAPPSSTPSDAGWIDEPDPPKPAYSPASAAEPAVIPPLPPPATPEPAEPAPELPTIRLPSGIEVDRSAGEVRVPATVAANVGWLEQVACVSGTRDHESLVSVEMRPSDVHAALLLLGAEPGRPGHWRYAPDNEPRDDEVAAGPGVWVAPPRGEAIDVLFRPADDAPHPASFSKDVLAQDWIRGVDGRGFPGGWVFAGSVLSPNPPSLGPGEHYVADFTGSVVGLVTFGDETVAAECVIPDLVDVEAANWEAWTERMPDSGTPVMMVLRRARDSGAAHAP